MLANNGRTWLKSHIKFLKDNIHRGVEYASDELGRSEDATRDKAYELKIKIPKKGEEKNNIRRN